MTLAHFEQQFLNDLNDKLWKAADKLRSNLDAANYKHIVLGLVFLKYVSDAFTERRTELSHAFRTKAKDNLYFMDPHDYASSKKYEQAVEEELELVDYYREKNVFWVPIQSRWEILRQRAALPIGTVIEKDPQGTEIKLRSLSWLVDNALEAIEDHNPKLKGILNRISQYQLDNDKLKGLIDTFSDTSFTQSEYKGQRLSLHSKDVLGHVYEYFLGQFALAEGKQGGQYYTPKSIVSLIVEMLEPYKGRVYDPAMGSGGFFVSSDKFIEEHAKEKRYKASEQRRHISVYGQESNPTTWKLAAMNMAIRGIDFNFGKKNADTFLDDQHPDLRADFVMANPPFNMKEWWSARLEGDARWEYGTPPQGNGKRKREREFLFIDARQLGYMKDRVLRDFKDEDIAKICSTFHAWRTGSGYENQAGFCYSASFDEVAKNDYVLTPGRYVGAPEQEADSEPFSAKMKRLTAQLKEQFAESDKLEAQIKKNLGALGYWE